MRLPAPRPAAPLALLLLAGCAAGSGGGGPGPALPSSPWGAIAEEPPSPPEPLQGPLSVPTPSVRQAPQREFTAEERSRMDAAWALFRAQDPAWPEACEAWRGLGPEATAVLAENLYRAMVAARARSAPHLVSAARKELALLGEPAVPILTAGLATRAVRTPEGDELRMGMEVLHDAAEALSVIGAPAVPGLMDIARSGVKVLVREAVWALGNVADPRSEDLLVVLAGDGDWDVRGAAVQALRGYPSARAGETLLARMEDTEGLVVRRSAEALAARGSRDVLPGLVGVLERASTGGRVLQANAAAWTLGRLTGENHGLDAAAWRAALKGR